MTRGDSKVLEARAKLSRFVGVIRSAGHPQVSIYVPDSIRRSMSLKASQRILVTLELINEYFVSPAVRKKNKKRSL